MSGSRPALSCIVLAAGSSRRFGSDKRQARLFDGRTLLEATLSSIPPLFRQRILVLQPGDTALAEVHADSWQVIIADTARQGMGHSLTAGLAACVGADAALVVLADMPGVSLATYEALVQQLRTNRIVFPRHDGRRGNPVGIGADFFTELAAPDGDEGARRLVQLHPEAVHWVDCADAGILQDIDRPEDLTDGRIPGY